MQTARVGRARVGGSDREMMRLVAELYYLRDLTQPEIARLTGFSVSKVSRLLAQARSLGVVRISVEPPSEVGPAVARALADRFGVEVHLTPGGDPHPSVAARLCGVGAAEVITRELPRSGVVGITGGYTIGALVSALPRLERPELTVVPLVGGWDTRNPHLDCNELVRRFAERLSAEVRFLHAPGMLDSEETKLALLRDSGIAATTRYWERLSLAIVGTSGGPLARPGYGTVMDRLDEAGRRRLADKEVVGDLGGHLFRADGSFVDDEWSRRTIAIPIELLRRTPRVVLVAAGSNKVDAVAGALRSGLVHVLVTDRATAEAVLEAVEKA
ncbi:MAG TPA: sugar-binding domain-containing protein, partial [Candidatus Binatia bacterium]|nr:sugar-binding domain-containing protein [Candidatus Binatia bacterium]